MFNFLKKSNAVFDPKHEYGVIIDNYVLDMNSIHTDDTKKEFYCIIMRCDQDIYHISDCIIYYADDKRGIYQQKETVEFTPATGEYKHRKYPCEITQYRINDPNDPIGVIYNTYQDLMGSALKKIIREPEIFYYDYIDQNNKLHRLSFFPKSSFTINQKIYAFGRDAIDKNDYEEYVLAIKQDGSYNYEEYGRFINGRRVDTIYHIKRDFTFDNIVRGMIAYLRDPESAKILPKNKTGLIKNIPHQETKEERAFRSIFFEQIGKDDILEKIFSLYNWAMHFNIQENNDTDNRPKMHAVFIGNPGCGKKYLANCLGNLYIQSGLLTQGHIYRAAANSLHGEFIGFSAKNLTELYNKARGGVLILTDLDNITELGGVKSDGGKEILDRLLSLMQDDKTGTVVLLTSTEKAFLKLSEKTPDLINTFINRYDVNDLDNDELTELTLRYLKENRYQIANNNEVNIQNKIKQYVARQRKVMGKNFGNGKLSATVYERIIQRQMLRVGGSVTKDDTVRIILPSDIPSVSQRNEKYNLDAELSNVIGLENVKKELKKLNATILMQQAREQYGAASTSGQSLHMVFRGNPGTGKTSVANIIAKILYNLGVIEKEKIVDVTATDLIKDSQSLKKTFRSAMGGVLFIDEAYGLADTRSSAGIDTVNELVALIENNRDSIVVILAGYTDSMDRLFAMNQGLQSRFTTFIDFPDYSNDELISIAKKMAGEQKFVFSDDVPPVLEKRFQAAREEKYFSNARVARNIVDEAIKKQSQRLAEKYSTANPSNISPDELFLLIAEDFV